MNSRIDKRLNEVEFALNAMGATMYVTEGAHGADPDEVLRALGIALGEHDMHVYLWNLGAAADSRPPRLVATHPLKR